jgi:glycosyltransferase involved in cell wall biosynthesis
VRVLYIDSKFATPRKSAPTRAYAFARHLVERGHEVTMIGRDPGWLVADGNGKRGGLVSREHVDGIDVVWLNVPYRNDYSKYRRIAAYGGFMAAATVAAAVLPRHDVVYASSIPLTIGVPGVAASTLKRAPFVFELQDVWPAVPVGLGVLTSPREIAAAEALERALYRRSVRIVVCSERQKELLVERDVPAAKVVVVPNFADVDLFRPGVVDPGWRASLGLDDKFVAVYTGGMGRSSGIQQLFDAAVALHDRGERGIALVAYGRGSERARLERDARERSLRNIHFPDIVPRDRIPGIVGSADATLTLFAPYKVLEQNSPNKFFDGLAAAKPVVVNVDGWLRGIVEDNEAGLYVPAGDGDALADALVELARDPERRARMGANGRSVAERDFARDLLADRVADLLEEVAVERRRQPA